MSACCFQIDVPLLPQTALGHALGMVELLRTANLLAQLRQGPGAPRMGWRFVDASGQPLPPETGALEALQREGAPHGGPADAWWLAPLHGADIPAIRQGVERHAALARRVAVAVDAGALVCTLGNGAWLAARGGGLGGRRVSLPWFYIAGFRTDFPAITPATETDFCEDGPWLSAASPADLGPLAAALVRRALGPSIADTLAAALRPDRERAAAAAQAQRGEHITATRDGTLARAIAHLERHVESRYDLEALAHAAAVSPRTLLRHFRQELGHSPLDHLHQLRCARARVLLEITLESVPTIALACGYSDPAAFRRIFRRHTGHTPAAYRQQHALRAPRRRWRVPAGASVEAVLAALRRSG